MTKYTSVSIPLTLHKRLEKLIAKKTGFKSVSDYVTYVLREVVAMHEMKEVPEPFTSTDLAEIKERLQGARISLAAVKHVANSPHGGKLVQVKQSSKDSSALAGFKQNQKLKVSKETATVVSNIANGIFSPLEGFMGENDYLNVLEHMRLENDVPWTIPDTTTRAAQSPLRLGRPDTARRRGGPPRRTDGVRGELRDLEGGVRGKVFGTEDKAHPGVAKIFAGNECAISGKLKAAVKPDHGDYADYTLTPKETRILFAEKGWNTVVAFQTRNAPHINHEYLQKSALALWWTGSSSTRCWGRRRLATSRTR